MGFQLVSVKLNVYKSLKTVSLRMNYQLPCTSMCYHKHVTCITSFLIFLATVQDRDYCCLFLQKKKLR